MDGLVIPESHWRKDTVANDWRVYVPGWTRALQSSIASEPDPAERFSKWLEDQAGSESRNLKGLGVRLVFIEEPYLTWAETVERIIANTATETRELIAYEVTHPDRDC